MQHEFRGTDLTITYDDEVCTHAAECVRGLPNVFDPEQSPWVNPDGAPVDAIRESVSACPSGALGVRADD